jgi:hypothetical protein
MKRWGTLQVCPGILWIPGKPPLCERSHHPFFFPTNYILALSDGGGILEGVIQILTGRPALVNWPFKMINPGSGSIFDWVKGVLPILKNLHLTYLKNLILE